MEVLVAAGFVLVLAAFAWVLISVIALTRQVDQLHRRVEVVAAANPSALPRTGLSPGTEAPEIVAHTVTGAAFSSRPFRGAEYLVVLAHPGCAPCEKLMSELIPAVIEKRVPPTIVVSQGRPEDHAPALWKAPTSEECIAVVLDDHHRIAKSFESFSTPHAFVISRNGTVAAQGLANSVADIKAMGGTAPTRRSSRRVPIAGHGSTVGGVHDG